jgi:ATP-dependent Clp protease ATP-binding subunit ClpB
VQASIGDKLARELLAGRIHDGDTAVVDLPASKDSLEVSPAA